MSATTVMPGAERSRVPVVAAALLAATVGYLAVLVAKPGGAGVAVAFSDVATASAAVAAAVTCVLAGRRHAGWLRAFWWLLAAAGAAWATGEMIWTWYEVVLDVPVPYPSVADIGYLAGTPLAVAAFACHPSAHSGHQRRVLPLLDAIAVACALLFVSWTLVLGPLSGSGGMSLGDVVSVAYPFGDVIVLVLVVLALRNLPSGNRPATLMLLGGLFVMAVTDTTYTYLALADSYTSGDVLDAGWFAAYLAIAAAGVLYESPLDIATPRNRDTVLSVAAPFVPILVALAVIAVQVPRGRQLTSVEWVIALCLTVVVVTRQLLYAVRRAAPVQGAGRRGAAVPTQRAPVAPVAPLTPAAGTSTGMPTDVRSELQALTLQMVAAARPSAQERAQRVSGSMVMALTSTAAVLALWDLSILVRAAA